MTVSQRPERVDRAVLIEAAVRALVDSETNGLCGENWPQPCDGCDCFRPDHPNESAALDRSRAGHVLDAVLPLIADAIEDSIRLGESVHYEFCSLAQAGALVRSYLDGGQ